MMATMLIMSSSVCVSCRDQTALRRCGGSWRATTSAAATAAAFSAWSCWERAPMERYGGWDTVIVVDCDSHTAVENGATAGVEPS
jgi:hypothetical protein